MDDVLRLNHIQVKGTHNSYRIAPYEIYGEDGVPLEWDYTHADLDVQFGEQGVRQIELDVWWDTELNVHRVLHAPLVDDVSNCDLFTECLRIVRDWSDENPWHLPIFVHVETKDVHIIPDEGEMILSAVEEDFHEIFPRDKLITPDEVRGDHETLLEAITKDGWPTLGEVRGRIMPILLDTRAYTEYYTNGHTSLEGRLMFVTGELDTPTGVSPKIDNPIRNQEQIQQAVKDGIIVRTRSDTPGNQILTGCTERLEAALGSGAQIISTDYPAPVPGVDFLFEIPGVPQERFGRCNPITAPPECHDEALEPPLF